MFEKMILYFFWCKIQENIAHALIRTRYLSICCIFPKIGEFLVQFWCKMPKIIAYFSVRTRNLWLWNPFVLPTFP